MSRLARKNLNTPYLHIMVQGINKEFIFPDNKCIETYLRLLNIYKRKYSITILAYCIMNNHAHILVYTKQIDALGKFMHNVNLVYSQFYNKQKNRCGVVFRNKYQSQPIYDIKHLFTCIKYIHMNPVKAAIVKRCEDYTYSSYNHYTNNTGLCTDEIFRKILGSSNDFQLIFNKIPDCIFIDIDSPKTSDIYTLIDLRHIVLPKKT